MPTDAEQRDRVVLVTGASKGIGRAIAEAFGARGAKVVVNYLRDQDGAEAAAAQIRQAGGQALTWQADVGQREAVEEMFAAAIEQFGRLDVAVANAYYSHREENVTMPWAQFLRTIEVTQFGVFHTCQLAAQQMVRQVEAGSAAGDILIIGSVHGQHLQPNSTPYDMSKAAANHLARTLAVEVAPWHINVNVISPGWIDTPGERAFTSDAELRAWTPAVPWNRLGKPEEIAEFAVFMCSAAADYMTGAVVTVDGGFLLGMGI